MYKIWDTMTILNGFIIIVMGICHLEWSLSHSQRQSQRQHHAKTTKRGQTIEDWIVMTCTRIWPLQDVCATLPRSSIIAAQRVRPWVTFFLPSFRAHLICQWEALFQTTEEITTPTVETTTASVETESPTGDTSSLFVWWNWIEERKHAKNHNETSSSV